MTSYFFQLHSPYYNIFDNHYSIFLTIEELGHHVGLHFDCYNWRFDSEGQLSVFILLDKMYLEKALME